MSITRRLRPVLGLTFFSVLKHASLTAVVVFLEYINLARLHYRMVIINTTLVVPVVHQEIRPVVIIPSMLRMI